VCLCVIQCSFVWCVIIKSKASQVCYSPRLRSDIDPRAGIRGWTARVEVIWGCERKICNTSKDRLDRYMKKRIICKKDRN
jgi:hypothetical protein